MFTVRNDLRIFPVFIAGKKYLTNTNTILFRRYTMGLRVSDHAQEVGLDESEHGAQAYELGVIDEIVAKGEKEVEARRGLGASGLPGLGTDEGNAKLDSA